MCQVKGCQDPEGCARKAKYWAAYQERNLWKGEELLAEIRKLRSEKREWTKNTDHAEEQKINRCISERDERLLIDHEAWPFEYYKDGHGTEELGLVGNLKVGKKLFRPIHIILKRNNGGLWKVVTIYDPRSEGFLWANNYQKRICFCR